MRASRASCLSSRLTLSIHEVLHWRPSSEHLELFLRQDKYSWLELKIIFPYDRIYPGKPCFCPTIYQAPYQSRWQSSTSICAISSARSMPRWESILIDENWLSLSLVQGALCTWDAIWDWKDGVTVVVNRVLPTSESNWCIFFGLADISSSSFIRQKES